MAGHRFFFLGLVLPCSLYCSRLGVSGMIGLLWLRSPILFILTKITLILVLKFSYPKYKRIKYPIFLLSSLLSFIRYSIHYNMKIGIVGAGIAGLGLALRICKAAGNVQQPVVRIF